ncbi:nicotinate-nucleotide adenylyltransferase [Aequorivita sp. H23M31]|uniref:Nicotinate-nucleotide adenylyltransferase n=1 Tax=Aequorivita ciconiae TaxID=2494375 RepID=A0A410G3S9_9FLAO|nr:ATP-binding protein [Aequorivita sp. H23M31]QAA81875.1 nicotinate-nucleotide adenylyltransferase [Aequorivita sp. H23M31]
MIKVVLYGPESTGKTTLAKQLAVYYNTEWVPEFMREYLEEKWERDRKLVSREDLVPIAKGQLAREMEASSKVDKLLICDTNLLELKVYSEYYYNGYCPEFIENQVTNLSAVEEDNYSIYLLTYIDIPWEADILRDRPHNREEMFRIFEAELKKQGLHYKILKGNEKERFNKAIEIIDALLFKH